MKTFKILNHLGDTQKIVEVDSIEAVEDVIYDLKDYHGHYSVFTYVEVK